MRLSLCSTNMLLAILVGFSSCSKKNYDVNNTIKFATPEIINQRIGRGINIGDTYESSWNTAKDIDTTDFSRMASIGLKSVRIPIRWELPERTQYNSPYTINPSFFARIKRTVDAALRNKLHVIINMHHHDSLFANPDAMKPMFLAQWQQIANYFKDYPDSLLFEVLNEPHGNLDIARWNLFFEDALKEIRKTNPERTVFIGLADWGGVSAINQLALPADNHLILTVHFYNPFQFTHQGAGWVSGSSAWLGTKWNDTEFERQDIIADFTNIKQFASIKNIPVNIGEFGAYSAADITSRTRWTRFLARWFEQQGFSWSYWEFNSGFGIYNPSTGLYNSSLKNALLVDAMPNPTPVTLTDLYNSNFNNPQNDGWFLSNNDPSASSSLAINNNKATISILAQGNETWHIQFIRHNTSIVSGKMYRVLFNAYSLNSRNISCQIMQSATPWTVYRNADFSISSTDNTYSFVFTASTTDTNCNFVFSLGKNGILPVIIYNIKLQEITI